MHAHRSVCLQVRHWQRVKDTRGESVIPRKGSCDKFSHSGLGRVAVWLSGNVLAALRIWNAEIDAENGWEVSLHCRTREIGEVGEIMEAKQNGGWLERSKL